MFLSGIHVLLKLIANIYFYRGWNYARHYRRVELFQVHTYVFFPFHSVGIISVTGAISCILSHCILRRLLLPERQCKLYYMYSLGLLLIIFYLSLSFLDHNIICSLWNKTNMYIDKQLYLCNQFQMFSKFMKYTGCSIATAQVYLM